MQAVKRRQTRKEESKRPGEAKTDMLKEESKRPSEAKTDMKGLKSSFSPPL